MAARQRVRVRVPATSANLGPGFDSLGLALALHDEAVVEITSGGLVVEPYAAGVPTDESNLVVRALRAGFEATGGQPAGLSLSYTSRIPHARGLGSSSAAICAGVVAALALRGADDRGRGRALALACALEGHPDNVAACLLGGLTVAWSGAGGPAAVRLEPHPAVRPVVLIPSVTASTEQSRGALPGTVPHRDAAAAAGRAALLVAGLMTRPDVLLDATEDWLHQPYRLPRLPLVERQVATLRAAGLPAVLSGSGPTVLVLCRSADEVALASAIGSEAAGPDGVSVSPLAVDPAGATACGA